MLKRLSMIEGDVSGVDLLRVAAEQSIRVEPFPESFIRLKTPLMRGKLLTQEVQPGLIFSYFDVTYTADLRVKVEQDCSVTCAILLQGDGEALEIDGLKPIAPRRERVQIVGLGETHTCVRPAYAGQHARVFSVVLQPDFFARFGEIIGNDGLSGLRRFSEPGVRSVDLPRSGGIIDLANSTLDEPYGGSLLTLFSETQALRFTLEIAAMLGEDFRLSREMGRRQYDRACEAREALDRALVNPPKVLDLARQLGVNVTTLQANFKAAFGTTIFGYVRTRRLEVARILIREQGLGAAEAGYKAGFTSPSAFSTAFRRHFGHPPSSEQ